MPQRLFEKVFNIEGQIVRCTELDGNRLWTCSCAAFQDRLARLHEGFCAHTVIAIMDLPEGEAETSRQI